MIRQRPILSPLSAFIFVFIFVLGAFSLPLRAENIATDTAVLRWLDKVTGRVSTLEATVAQSEHLGTLEIIVRTCVKRPPTETPESAAFLDIAEIRPGRPSQEVFRGWMFASSPALSAMEHPVYDVWVLECANAAELQKRKPVPEKPEADVVDDDADAVAED